MTDRFYRTLLGLFLLVGLYLESSELIYGITAMLLVEGITNLRLPILVCGIRKYFAPSYATSSCPLEVNKPISRFNIEAELVWRLVVGTMLLVTYYFYGQLWFFPWFMGFAILGAGISGVCPVLLAIQWTGFK